MRTWKMDGPPEIVAGMVMYVITSWSLRPANRARKAPAVWIPSCEFPARRITASLIFSGRRSARSGGGLPVDGTEGGLPLAAVAGGGVRFFIAWGRLGAGMCAVS